ncbi:hypothetical protein EX895_001612 [Sporisorium graminicola]|uniref:Uncharacterized protein n=1 Tax=Sporisorium graminicola TaxID=280036 RepID=A0A4U7KWJ4_9BASI|nr:hypothetical protein EX895_001612 [Sporisorium graminicola]TKY89081.1 hypothetical protein EX895_001612 [Sporisorium graminicola]
MTANASSPVSSWLPDHATTPAFPSLGLLISPRAIPLYLILAFYLLSYLPSLLERLFTPAATPSTSAFVVPAETRHARFLPTTSTHAFRYNTLYLALRLDRLERRALDTGHAFAWKGAVFQPEFVDHAALAERRGVTPAGAGVAGAEEARDAWKAKMRAVERIERLRLEEKRGRNDRMTWSLTGLHPDGYLRTHIPLEAGDQQEKGKWISGSILLKLAYELRERGFLTVGPQDSDGDGKDWRHELGHVWTVTMPSIAGITGINPLTVHFCYRPHGFIASTAAKGPKQEEERGSFWLVVLEVHNTFSERHIYILEAGKNEDTTSDAQGSNTRGGYDHQWTFPRAFHVSPFNDRGGFYRLFLKEPFGPQPNAFVLGVRLLLLVESPDAEPQGGPKLVKKLMATLDSVSPSPPAKATTHAHTGRRVRPLSAATLYAALMRQPVDLFLTFVRILYQAGKLHFAKRLDAFGRPDMVQSSETQSADRFDGVGLPPALNRIQLHRKAAAASGDGDGGVMYPEPGWAELVAKEYVKEVVQRRANELQAAGERWTVQIVSTDPADSGLHISSAEGEKGGRQLVLYTRSYGIYVDLMTYTPPRLAFLLGSIVSRRWGVTSLDDFNAFFANPLTPCTGIRRRHVNFLLTSASHDRAQAEQLLRDYGIDADTVRGGDEGGWKVTVALWLGFVAAVAEKKVFAWLGARYVKGTEPWLSLERGLAYVKLRKNQAEEVPGDEVGWDSRLGSVYRA